MKKIEIIVDKTLSGLAGFDYGKKVYNNQVKNKLSELDYKNGFYIVFPSEIKRVASSFVQGFFSELMTDYGYYKVVNMVKIESSSDKLTNYIVESLG